MLLRDQIEERQTRASWGLVAGAVIGGAVSYAGQKSANKQSAKNAKGQGQVDTTTTRTGDPRADPYRDAGMQAAYGALFGGGPAVAGDPTKAPAGGVPAGYNKRPDGRVVPNVPTAKGGSGGGGKGGNKKPAGAGGAGAAAPVKFEGMSPETDAIRQSMMKLPEQNADMFGTSEKFLTDTLEGTERNAYRPEAADAARAIAEDPRMERYLDFLEGGSGKGASKTPPGQKVNLGTVGRAYSQGGDAAVQAYSGGGAAGPSSPNTVPGATATGTDLALRKLVGGELPVGWADMEAGITRSTNEGRADIIRQLKAAAVGSGSYGGSVYEDAIEGAIARGDRELADSLGAARFGAFQNALGLGTTYDLGMADLAGRERMNAANASAASSAAGADAASRERLAMAGMWGDALGLSQQGRAASAGALGDLAGLTSTDQRAALAGINDLAAGRRGDLGVAGDLSLGADSNRNSYIAAQRQQQASNAATNAGARAASAGLAFDRERFYDPMARTSQYADLLNAFYGNFGSERTVGTDTRASGGGAAVSPWGAALSGAALGAQVGSQYRKPPATASGG